MVSAPDVITYVGVPLAVLGVLPIFYTCVRSIIALRSIRHVLKANGLGDGAITRGSLMSGVVEVEIPRRRIAPLDRELDAAYWKLNPHQISLPGGTWAIFSWNQILTGRTLYRCQYKEELRVPPAEINFEELVGFLLDRGAIPDAKGWKVLKSIGLWTPTGTILLRAPVDGSPVLKLAPPYDGDGILRLSVAWSAKWDQRNVNSLPPFWMRLERPTSYGEEDSPQSLLAQIEEMHGSSETGASSDSIRFHAVEGHVRHVHFERKGMLTGDERVLCGGEDSANQWFAWTAAALSQKSDCGLWNISIPPNIAALAKGFIPSGVMVLLGILQEDDVPPFAEPPPRPETDAMARHRSFLDSQRQRALESKMPPAQAEEARRQRTMAESRAIHDQHMQSVRARQEYEERRLVGALNSQPLAISVVAEKNLTHLIKKEVIPCEYTLDELARGVLYLMAISPEEAKLILEVLEKWLAWSQQGGLKEQHLKFLQANTVAFCYASALLAAIERAERLDPQGSSDIMECLRIWETVHLG